MVRKFDYNPSWRIRCIKFFGILRYKQIPSRRVNLVIVDKKKDPLAEERTLPSQLIAD